MQLSKLLSLIILGVSAAAAQQSGSSTSTTSGATSATSSGTAAATPSGTGAATPSGNSSATLVELLTDPNNTLGVSKFVDLIQSDSGYKPVVDLLSQPGNYTCFVPSNRVMSRLLLLWRAYAESNNLNATDYPPANLTVQNLTLADIVSYHILNEKVQLANASNYVNVAHSTLNKTDVDLLGTGLPVLIQNNATFKQFNNQSWLQANSQYLKYEVGNGNDEADVRYHDLEASNGYANVINSILIPPMSPSIVIQQTDDVEYLANLFVEHPELAAHLNSSNNFTFFAPSDRALRGANIESMDNDTIKELIMNHFVEGVYYTTNFTDEAASNSGQFNLTTINNGSLPVSVNSTSNVITLNETARIVEPNIFFNNGVMHVINKILNATESTGSTNSTSPANSTGASGSTGSSASSTESASSTGSVTTESADTTA